MIAGGALLLLLLSFSEAPVLQNLVKIIVVSIAFVLLLGEVVVIVNLYKASKPVKYLIKKGKDALKEMNIEDRNFLLRDLELQKELTDQREQKIETGAMAGNADECRKQKYQLQSLIDKIKTFSSGSVSEIKNSGSYFNFHSFR